jgi:phenylalanyl-tRNA synthetase alpha chain
MVEGFSAENLEAHVLK